MAVIVQNNYVTALTGPLARWAQEADQEVFDFSWTDDLVERIDYTAFPDERMFVMGSTAFVRDLRESILAPHISWNRPAFAAKRWPMWFGENYLGFAGVAMPLNMVETCLPAAVRPAFKEKAFNGGVYTLDTWRPIRERLDGVDSALQCWLMPIIKIEEEHRCWIVDRKVVAASMYRRGDAMSLELSPPKVIKEASKYVGDVPLRNIVLDLALTPDGWKVLELNCIHTSGWYAVDPGDVVGPFLHGGKS